MKLILSIVAVATILFLILREPQAPTVTAAQIQTLQADGMNGLPFILVDVRDKAESDVSMIPGAITVDEFEKTEQDHQGKTIITYCTVGHRSGIYAQKLKRKGWRALNYEGSILDWCEHQLPVVTPSGQNTKRVHTYNSRYALASGYQPLY